MLRAVWVVGCEVLLAGVAPAQDSKSGLMLDLAAIYRGKRAAVEKVFGKPVSSSKSGGMTIYKYKSKKLRNVWAAYPKGEVMLNAEYKPRDVKDWKSILAQFGLSVPTPRAVHKFFHWSDYITQFNEIPQGTVDIGRERKKGSEAYSGWVSVEFYSAKGPPPD